MLIVLLGTTATESKVNFMEWVDQLVVSVATEHCKVYTTTGIRDHGNFANLTTEQFIIVLARFSMAQTWMLDIVNNGYSCGAFFVMTGGGLDCVTQQGMLMGPFQT